MNYTFGQVSITHPLVDYSGNCGNISSGVGPFAIDEGLVKAVEPVTTVRIHNTNTGKILVAEVPVMNGKALVDGEYTIAGVPGTGAKIMMDFAGTAGAVTGKMLPTGKTKDVIDVPGLGKIEVSIVDVANNGLCAGKRFGIDWAGNPGGCRWQPENSQNFGVYSRQGAVRI